LAKVDQGKCGTPIFGTLTYPAEFPLDEETFKRHLKIFSQRFLRAFPHAAFHWKLEFQNRGAAHFHPIFGTSALIVDRSISVDGWQTGRKSWG
jgi:hypothetical protein